MVKLVRGGLKYNLYVFVGYEYLYRVANAGQLASFVKVKVFPSGSETVKSNGIYDPM